MKRLCVLLGGVALAVVAYAAVDFARGHGAIRVSEHSLGVFSFEVVKHGDRVRGWLDYHEMTARRGGNRISLPRVMDARFDGNRAGFAGPGTFNRHPVFVIVHVVDGGEEHDFFAIVCRNRAGNTVYEARGPVVRGQIFIGSRD